MKISLDEIFNVHKGEPCLILGSGDSLNNLKYENFSGKIIALGSTILRLKKLEKISYFVSANNHFPIPEIRFHLDFLNGLTNTTWLMSDTAITGIKVKPGPKPTYHNETRMQDGQQVILADIGSVGNLCGSEWAQSMAQAVLNSGRKKNDD